MNHWHFIARQAGPIIAALLLIGCDGGNGNSGPVGPDISGDWSGRYYFTDGTEDQSIDASITVNGDAVFIETTLPDTGRLLSGTMDAEGDMFMTDAFDGQTWTTFDGPVSADHVMLLDYAYGPGSSVFRVIDLQR